MKIINGKQRVGGIIIDIMFESSSSKILGWCRRTFLKASLIVMPLLARNCRRYLSTWLEGCFSKSPNSWCEEIVTSPCVIGMLIPQSRCPYSTSQMTVSSAILRFYKELILLSYTVVFLQLDLLKSVGFILNLTLIIL